MNTDVIFQPPGGALQRRFSDPRPVPLKSGPRSATAVAQLSHNRPNSSTGPQRVTLMMRFKYFIGILLNFDFNNSIYSVWNTWGLRINDIMINQIFGQLQI